MINDRRSLVLIQGSAEGAHAESVEVKVEHHGHEHYHLPQPEKAPPTHFNPSIPPFAMERFVERNVLFRQIDAAFSSSNRNLPFSPTILTACHGLGGVGKTQLALYYYYKSQKTYSFRCWFLAEHESQLDQQYGDFCRTFNIPFDEKAPFSIINSRVKQWLEEHPGWLLIYDNATDCDSIAKHLPRTGGDILVTSRHTLGWDQINGKAVPVEVVTKEEAIELVKRKLSSDSMPELLNEQDETSLKDLVEELGRLPLALAQAAAYIKKLPTMTITAYLKKYSSTPHLLLAKPLDASVYPESVTKTWLITMGKIEKECPAAVHVLKACAYLAPDEIPVELLSQLTLELNSADGKKEGKEEVTLKNNPLLDEILICLSGFSMVKIKKIEINDRVVKAVYIHRLVQKIISLEDSKNLDSEKILIERFRSLSNALLNTVLNENHPTDVMQYEFHIKKIITLYDQITFTKDKKFIDDLDKKNLIKLNFLLGKIYYRLYKFELSQSSFQKADEICNLMNNEIDILELQSKILFIWGKISFQSEKEYEKYIPILEKSLSMREKFLKGKLEDTMYFDIKRHIGCLYINIDLERAENYFSKLVAEIDRNSNLDLDSKIVFGQVCLNYAHMMYKKENFYEANTWLNKAIPILSSQECLDQKVYSIYWARELYSLNNSHQHNPQKNIQKAKEAIKENIVSLQAINKKSLDLEIQLANSYFRMVKLCLLDPLEEYNISIYIKYFFNIISKLNALKIETKNISKMKSEMKEINEKFNAKTVSESALTHQSHSI